MFGRVFQLTLSFNLTLDDNMVAEYGVDCEVTVVRWRIALDEK